MQAAAVLVAAVAVVTQLGQVELRLQIKATLEVPEVRTPTTKLHMLEEVVVALGKRVEMQYLARTRLVVMEALDHSIVFQVLLPITQVVVVVATLVCLQESLVQVVSVVEAQGQKAQRLPRTELQIPVAVAAVAVSTVHPMQLQGTVVLAS